MKRVAMLVLSLAAFRAHAQAVPWDATYNPATRTTTISASTTVPKYGTAANSPWGFSTAANGSVYAKATGSIPGPLGPATTTAGAAVARGVAAKALGIAVKALPFVGAAAAAWDLYQQFGAKMGDDGQPVTYEFAGNTKFAVHMALAGKADANGFSNMGSALSYASGQVTDCPTPGPGQPSDGCWQGGGMLKPNQGGSSFIVQKMRTNNGTPQPNDIAEIFPYTVQENKVAPFDLNQAAAQDSGPDLAPALNEAVQSAPMSIPMPALKPEPSAMPAPQATPWAAAAANPAAQERAVYTPAWSEAKQAIEWNKTNEVKMPDGSVKSTPESAPAGSGDGVDICVAHPEILACQELGEADDDQDLNRKDKQVGAITPWGSFGPSAGSCPSLSASFLGHQIAVDFKLVCDGLGWMRPAVLGLAWLMAAFIFIGGVKQE